MLPKGRGIQGRGCYFSVQTTCSTEKRLLRTKLTTHEIHRAFMGVPKRKPSCGYGKSCPTAASRELPGFLAQAASVFPTRFFGSQTVGHRLMWLTINADLPPTRPIWQG